MRSSTIQLVIYTAPDGRQPFVDWFDRLRDRVAQAAVAQRMDRLQCGNAGDCRSLGRGLMELRIATGPGYRVYFTLTAPERCLILCGGTKRTQATDIERARRCLKEARKFDRP